jgi:uncharacterized caspase-like protein
MSMSGNSYQKENINDGMRSLRPAVDCGLPPPRHRDAIGLSRMGRWVQGTHMQAASSFVRYAGRIVMVAMMAVAAIRADAEEKALKGVALVIGQSAYEHLPPLANPENDAEAIDQLLSDLGFEVDLVRDVDRKKLARSLDRFLEDAEGADVALLYYSGHGIEAAGENFMLPVDADDSALGDAAERLMPLSRILADLQAKVPVTIVLLDACRTSPFPAGATVVLEPGAAPVAVGATGLGTPRGVVALGAGNAPADGLGAVLGFAAAPGTAALDGDPGGNSPYATALLKHLSAGGYAFGDVMTMVTEEVYLRTDARQTPWTNSSLRRLLFFGEAPEEESGDEAAIRGERRKLLLTLSSVPDVERRQVATVARESGVPMDALFAMLKAVGADTPDDPNQLARLLNDQAARLKTLLAERETLKIADPQIAELAALAGRAVEEGALEAAISFHERAKARVAELDGTLADAEADLKARRLEHGAVFAASAETYALAYDHAHAAEDFAKAYEQVERWDDGLALRYKLAEAQALSDLGFFRGDIAATDRAIDAFAEAVRLAPADTDPQGWTDAQSGRAIALWARGERQADLAGLQEARAVLNEALASKTIADLPGLRANLEADLALVLMTIGMREAGTDSLDAAAASARAALGVKTREAAPQQYARLQNHLGSILFVQGVREQSPDRLRESAAALRAALDVWTPETTPLDWANAQNNLALAVGELGSREPGSETLLEAVDLLKSALDVRTREVAPLHWAESLTNLAATYHQLGIRDSETTKWFDEAVTALNEALEEITRERNALKWAAVVDNLGLALANIAERTSDVAVTEKAIATYRLALEERTVERVPLDWASTQSNLGNALYRLGEFAKDPSKHREAVEIFNSVLKVRTRDVDAIGWARAQNNLANVLSALGEHEEGTAQLEQAVAHYRLALEEYPRDINPINFADTHYNIALVQLSIGKKTGAKADFDKAREALKTCVDVYHAAGITQYDSFFESIEVSIEYYDASAQVDQKLKSLKQ